MGHMVTAEGISPDPGKAEAFQKLPMPTNISQLCWLFGGPSYYGKLLPKMAALTKALNELLKKGVAFVWTMEHTQIMQALLERMSSPDVLAFPDFDVATTSGRLFHLITDASVDGLGAVVKREQKGGTLRPICY